MIRGSNIECVITRLNKCGAISLYNVLDVFIVLKESMEIYVDYELLCLLLCLMFNIGIDKLDN